MRADRANSADFPDAGYALVTTGVKDRTMRGLIEPNELLFNQSTELPVEVLCDARAVQFLQLRYLLTPRDVTCPPWTPLQGVLVDRWLEVQTTSASDDQARALPMAQVGALALAPALSMNSALLSALAPFPGTSLRIGPRELVLQQDDVARLKGQAIVMPVAYDSAWRSSSGQIRNVGGLLTIVDVTDARVVLGFVPDAVAILLALGMTLAQVVGSIGLIGLASVQPAAVRDQALISRERLVCDFVHRQQHRVATVMLPPLRRSIAFARPVLREPLYLLSLFYSAAILVRLSWRPQPGQEMFLPTALLLPITAVVIAHVSRFRWLRTWIALAVLAAGLVRVAIAGSRAAEALHDPLFYAVVSLGVAMVAVFTRHWPVVAATASAIAGSFLAVATLLPRFANFDVAFPAINGSAVERSITSIADQLGLGATVVLVALWVYAIASGWRRDDLDRVPAGVRGALLAALVLSLAGAIPMPPVAGSSMVTLGCLIGLTGARAPEHLYSLP